MARLLRVSELVKLVVVVGVALVVGIVAWLCGVKLDAAPEPTEPEAPEPTEPEAPEPTEPEAPEPTEPEAAGTPEAPPVRLQELDMRRVNYQLSLADLRTDLDLSKFASRGEKCCAQTLMTMFNAPFITVRPKWLRNPKTGCCLELDCYNRDLHIAVEYNGVQHYEAGHFGQTEADLAKQQARDQYKRDLCRRNGILFIEVPYTVSLAQIPSYIGAAIPEEFRQRVIVTELI